MNILLLGSGGREDALAWRLRQSPSCGRLIAAPGNPGIARWADCIQCDLTDPSAVVALAEAEEIDLVVVGPEAPLIAGVADACRAAGIAVFGPNKAAAQLEGSKGFTKDLCEKHGIPTARYGRVASFDEAVLRNFQFGPPWVIKADGLAAGKGVVIVDSLTEANRVAKDMLGGSLGEAGRELVIEEFLEGEEASLFALVDGPNAIVLASAQDHKRAFEGDEGPNTGGMGAYSPAPVLTPELERRAMEEIVIPTARAMAHAGMPFNGVLYAGLMLTADGPKLIEYNVRFGDPECEAIMPRIADDFAELLAFVATGRMDEIGEITLEHASTMTVIVAANGYPGLPNSGGVISGLEEAEEDGAIVFQAGTSTKDGQLIASGGRVLAVTAAGETLRDARDAAYSAIEKIDFADGFHRSDIGWRELKREELE